VLLSVALHAAKTRQSMTTEHAVRIRRCSIL
jgi:hypothetical protein